MVKLTFTRGKTTMKSPNNLKKAFKIAAMYCVVNLALLAGTSRAQAQTALPVQNNTETGYDTTQQKPWSNDPAYQQAVLLIDQNYQVQLQRIQADLQDNIARIKNGSSKATGNAVKAGARSATGKGTDVRKGVDILNNVGSILNQGKMRKAAIAEAEANAQGQAIKAAQSRQKAIESQDKIYGKKYTVNGKTANLQAVNPFAGMAGEDALLKAYNTDNNLRIKKGGLAQSPDDWLKERAKKDQQLKKKM